MQNVLEYVLHCPSHVVAGTVVFENGDGIDEPLPRVAFMSEGRISSLRRSRMKPVPAKKIMQQKTRPMIVATPGTFGGESLEIATKMYETGPLAHPLNIVQEDLLREEHRQKCRPHSGE